MSATRAARRDAMAELAAGDILLPQTRTRETTNLSGLPEWSYGSKSPVWWGTLGFVAIEGCGFVLAIGAHLYLWQMNTSWPLSAPLPDLWPGALMLGLLLVSLLPNWWVDRAAKRQDLRQVRIGLVIMTLFGLVPLVVRGFEFAHANVFWDQNAYGSMVWLLLGLHTLHLATDAGDTVVLTALMFTRHAHGKRFSDVSDNAFYWYFVVGAWVPIWFLLYILPRL
jgi:cytochrome c oxidase subunit III